MNTLTRRTLSIAIYATLTTTLCFAQEARPVKPTDDVPTWKEAVDKPMLAISYPGWTPPPTMDYPFAPPEKEEKPEELVCITVDQAKRIIEMCRELAYAQAELDLTQRNLEAANKRLNFLEADNYLKDHEFGELSKKYIALQNELRKANETIESMTRPR